MGVYHFILDNEERARNVIHRPTGHEADIDEHCYIISAFTVVCNWSDLKAAATNEKACTYVLAKFFPQGRGPHVNKVLTGKSKELNDMATNAKNTLDDAKKKAGVAGTFWTDETQKVEKSKSTEAAARARNALKSRMEESAKKRRVSIKGGCPVRVRT